MVLELLSSGLFGWHGEWLHTFPRYTNLDGSDLAAWNAWLGRPEAIGFLNDAVIECGRLAAVSARARGHAIIEPAGEGLEDGTIRGNLRPR